MQEQTQEQTQPQGQTQRRTRQRKRRQGRRPGRNAPPRLLVATALVALLTACGGAGGRGGGSGADSPDLPVAGTHWTIGAVTSDGVRSAAPDGARIDFGTDGTARGSTGCNAFASDVVLSGDTLTVSARDKSETACPEDAVRFETVWTKAFAGPLRGTLKGPRLTLTAPDGRYVLELTAEPAAPLRGTTWRIDGLVSGATVSSLPGDSGTKARLVIGEDGRVTGNLGCNNFSATARTAGGTLTVEGPVATTRMMCTGLRMRLETRLYELLGGPLTYRLDHRVLTLTDASGEGLTATAAKPGDR
ncbi:META domain-containing protein [Streptomyces sp. NPDC059247]|uniref:META domain-containing protein n=1 Tax=Streptomyces sp. NPDC059247 TaxID=3346790 RepID=UPI00367F07AD